jgi:hypothetical protein
VWNTWYSGELHTGYQLHVFTKDVSGDWNESYEFNPKKFDPRSVDFDSTGRMYAINSQKPQILSVTFKDDGSVNKTVTVPFSRNHSPYEVVATDDGYVYVSSWNRIDQYRAPLTKKSKIVRTIATTLDYNSLMTADDSGNVYSVNYDSGIETVSKWTAVQSGNVSPASTFTIDSSYTSGDATDITVTNTGQIAIVYNSDGIALFPANESGANQVPATWYPCSESGGDGYSGVDFDSNGVMATAYSGNATSIRLYFETP